MRTFSIGCVYSVSPALVVEPFRRLVCNVVFASLIDRFYRRDFRDRDIPPGFEPRYPGVLLHRNVDDDGARFGLGTFERLAQLAFAGGAHGYGAEAGRVGGEVDGDVGTV